MARLKKQIATRVDALTYFELEKICQNKGMAMYDYLAKLIEMDVIKAKKKC